MRVGGAWLVLEGGKGGFKEKRLGTTYIGDVSHQAAHIILVPLGI